MNLSCVICGELFTSTSDVHITPCGHMYHTACILQWFQRSKTCPQCRSKCILKSITKVFFNIANLDTSQIDIGSLQQELDNNILKNNETVKELENSKKEIENLKKMQKNCMKTISGLEKKVQGSQFLIQSYNEQFKIFKSNSTIVDEQRKEIKDLKHKIEMMSTVDTILTSTTAEVEKLVKTCNNKESLATWVVTLKRELRACENKRTDLRNTLKVVQNTVSKDNVTKKLLLERVSELESENYHINFKLKELIGSNGGSSSEFLLAKDDNKPQILNSPTNGTTNMKRINLNTIKTQSTSTSCNKNSPSLILKNLKTIEESTSPYLNIKSSSIGLAPLLNIGDRIRQNPGINKDDNLSQFGGSSSSSSSGNSKGTLKKSNSDLSDKFTIFKKPRLLTSGSNNTILKNQNMVFNGFGGSERKLDENYTLNIKKNANLSNRISKNSTVKRNEAYILHKD